MGRVFSTSQALSEIARSAQPLYCCGTCALPLQFSANSSFGLPKPPDPT